MNTPDTEFGKHQKHCHASMGYVCACTGKKPPRTCPFCLKDVAFCVKELNGCMKYVPTPISCTPDTERETAKKVASDIFECMEADWEDFSIDKNPDEDEQTNFLVDPMEFMTEVIAEALTSRDTYWKERVRKEVEGMPNATRNESENEKVICSYDLLKALDNLK